jgi:hypothetical protein
MLILLIFQKKASLIVSAIVIDALLSSINISNDYYELTTHNRSVYAIASAGFCALIHQTSTPKPVGALSARLSG